MSLKVVYLRIDLHEAVAIVIHVDNSFRTFSESEYLTIREPFKFKMLLLKPRPRIFFCAIGLMKSLETPNNHNWFFGMLVGV